MMARGWLLAGVLLLGLAGGASCKSRGAVRVSVQGSADALDVTFGTCDGTDEDPKVHLIDVMKTIDNGGREEWCGVGSTRGDASLPARWRYGGAAPGMIAVEECRALSPGTYQIAAKARSPGRKLGLVTFEVEPSGTVRQTTASCR
jgi:hypothetical protein